MPLQPNVPFSDGDSWTPDLAYQSFNSPVFDDQPQYLGHRGKILDAELSDNTGQIKDRVRFLEGSLKVTQESGLTVRYASGTISLMDNSVVTISSALLGVADNATTFIFIDRFGQPLSANRLPVIGIPLARVTAVNGQISQIFDLRHPNQKRVSPAPNAVQVFGGTSQVDRDIISGEYMSDGNYYFRDFRVPAGRNLFIVGSVNIFCSGNVNIEGNVEVLPVAPGVPQLSYHAHALGSVGGILGTGLGATGQPYPWAAQPYGSGGAHGNLQCNSGTASAYLGAGGAGGGGIKITAAGSISITGSISAVGYPGIPGGNFASGAAGGFTNVSALAFGGSGGGSGGLINLSSLTSIYAAPGARLWAFGGDGGEGSGICTTSTPILGIPGSGGGGGYVVLQSPSTNISGSDVRLYGGTSGTPVMYMVNGHANPLTQPTPGVYKTPAPDVASRGGIGGAYAGASVPVVTTQATESSILYYYYQKTVAGAGRLILLNATPIGN